MENQGGSGTAMSHWEKRLLEVNTFLDKVTSISYNTVLSSFLIRGYVSSNIIERRYDRSDNRRKFSIFKLHICLTGRQRVNCNVLYISTTVILYSNRWYKVNYSAAKMIVWGRGDGCSYIHNSCGNYIKSRRQQ